MRSHKSRLRRRARSIACDCTHRTLFAIISHLHFVCVCDFRAGDVLCTLIARTLFSLVGWGEGGRGGVSVCRGGGVWRRWGCESTPAQTRQRNSTELNVLVRQDNVSQQVRQRNQVECPVQTERRSAHLAKNAQWTTHCRGHTHTHDETVVMRTVRFG